MSNSVSPVKVSFSFDVFNHGEHVKNDIIEVALNDRTIREVAKVMAENGGHPVEMCALTKLSDLLFEQIFTKKVYEILPDEEDYDGVDVKIQEQMPEALVAAAEQYATTKSVHVDYNYFIEGKRLKETVSLQVSNRTFYAMRDLVLSDASGRAPFDSLRLENPEAYKEVYDLISEWAYKRGIRDEGEPRIAMLKDFPLEVFDAI